MIVKNAQGHDTEVPQERRRFPVYLTHLLVSWRTRLGQSFRWKLIFHCFLDLCCKIWLALVVSADSRWLFWFATLHKLTRAFLPRCPPPSWCSSAMESCCRLTFWHCDGIHCWLYKQIMNMTKTVVPGRGWEDSPAGQSLQWEQDIGEQVCLRDYLFQSDSIFISRVGAVKPSTGQHSNTEVELDQEEEERREEIRQEMEDKEREAELVARLANQLDHSVLHPELSVYYRLWQRIIAS